VDNAENKQYNNDVNADMQVVNDFGNEWQSMNQIDLPKEERFEIFKQYFSLFPWDSLPNDPVGFDAGCGSGRWALEVAPRVGRLHCIEPSSAMEVCKSQLFSFDNCIFHQTTICNAPIADSTMDFGYSLGVLHHIPDTQRALNDCTRKLKSGAPFLIYIYYAFDNQPFWFRWLWKLSEFVRMVVSKLPPKSKFFVTQLIALTIYLPLAKTALLFEKLGRNVKSFPLSAYRNKSFYSMRTDALDRFGTRLEKRFTRSQIETMMAESGLENIKFSEGIPFYCAIGTKR
jgi:SAM-dependent methyltransferase